MNKNNLGFNFEYSYLKLNNLMHEKLKPSNSYEGEIILLNEKLAKDLDIEIDYLKSQEGINDLLGNKDSKLAETFTQSYGGHQFGHFSVLGDGRALMLGEQLTKENVRYDIQLKGSGRTKYSRRGDGKATLYSMLREYLISEAMYFLNIPTTRSLSVIKTNEKINRVGPKEAAIMARVASSHLRVGTFEFAKLYGGYDILKELVDYSISRHFPSIVDDSVKYIHFLRKVIDKQASLVAKWQSVGFIHGVMNTDNVAISGETIDYGPCAFMDYFNPKTVFSSIDSEGRYSYSNQPYITSWNLAKFAEALLPLLHNNKETAVIIANTELQKFENQFFKYYLDSMALKIGIATPEKKDLNLIKELLDLMEKYNEDFTNTFRFLSQYKYEKILMYKEKPFKEWIIKWNNRLILLGISENEASNLMKANNPVLIARNHLVEQALTEASENNDYTLFNSLLKSLQDPFNYKININDNYLEPDKSKVRYITYCGT